MAGELADLQSQVRAKLPENAAEPDTRELRNFLSACGGVASKAAHVFCKSQQWRADEKVDGILSEEGGQEREGARPPRGCGAQIR